MAVVAESQATILARLRELHPNLPESAPTSVDAGYITDMIDTLELGEKQANEADDDARSKRKSDQIDPSSGSASGGEPVAKRLVASDDK